LTIDIAALGYIKFRVIIIYIYIFFYELFIKYYYFYRQNADLRLELRHVRGIFTSSEEKMTPQIKFPTSKNVLKDPLHPGIQHVKNNQLIYVWYIVIKTILNYFRFNTLRKPKLKKWKKLIIIN